MVPIRNNTFFLSPLLFIFLMAFLAMGCDGKKTPILSQEKMVEVMYDYQLAEVLAEQTEDGRPATMLEYRQAVFHKHQITEDDFNRSLAYYSRQTEKMKHIYATLQKKTGQENLFAETSAEGGQGVGAKDADSVFLWKKPDLILTANRQNRYVESVAVPPNLLLGDTLCLAFETSWLYRQGNKQAQSMLTVRYDNDSLDAGQLSVYSYESKYLLTLPLSAENKVKHITIQIYQNAAWDSALQLLHLKELKLFRRSVREKAYIPTADSLSKDTVG